MLPFRFSLGLILLGIIVLGCSFSKPLDLSAGRYIITAPQDALSEKWASYLFFHLSKRSKDTQVVSHHEGNPDIKIPTGTRQVVVEVNSGMEDDYCVLISSKKVILKAKEEATALWLVYQFIELLSQQDSRITCSDLDPAIIGKTSGCFRFDFKYRDPHYAPNLDSDYSKILGNNTVEEDWGLWGHNLMRIIPKDAPSSIYAVVNGKIDRSQFNFASPELYLILENYVLDNYGDGQKVRANFVITPNDNDVVSLDPQSAQLGNTPENSTPAVSYLINQLAERFPYHKFFMLGYRTTKSPPELLLRENAGVLLSTISIQHGVPFETKSNAVNEFIGQVKLWKERGHLVYVWDYSSNFDDYFTPLPVLYGLQSNLKTYKQLGIDGVFLNASGYDYTSFEDVKTYVISALMKDHALDINSLVEKYYKKKYPASGKLHSDYYLGIEKDLQEHGKPYSLYGSFQEATNLYLNKQNFVRYYDALLKIESDLKGEEKDKVANLLTALSFTRLQLAYSEPTGIHGYLTTKGNGLEVRNEVRTWLKWLSRYAEVPSMERYKESGGEIQGYIQFWNQLIAKKYKLNLLSKGKLIWESEPDENYENLDLIKDSVLGYPQDYHIGWLINSAPSMMLRFEPSSAIHWKYIEIGFLHDPSRGFSLPKSVELYQGERLVKKWKSTELSIQGGKGFLRSDISVNPNLPVRFKILKQDNTRSIAIDEVMVLN